MRYPREIADPHDRARHLLLRQLVNFVRDIRNEPISDHSRNLADELVHLAHSLHPETRQR